jgi:hypothetical protein
VFGPANYLFPWDRFVKPPPRHLEGGVGLAATFLDAGTVEELGGEESLSAPQRTSLRIKKAIEKGSQHLAVQAAAEALDAADPTAWPEWLGVWRLYLGLLMDLGRLESLRAESKRLRDAVPGALEGYMFEVEAALRVLARARMRTDDRRALALNAAALMDKVVPLALGRVRAGGALADADRTSMYLLQARAHKAVWEEHGRRRNDGSGGDEAKYVAQHRDRALEVLATLDECAEALETRAEILQSIVDRWSEGVFTTRWTDQQYMGRVVDRDVVELDLREVRRRLGRIR